MNLDVWKPIYADAFDSNKYLYHYTSAETAIKIIHSDNLLFSGINKTNDTSEAKMRLYFTHGNIVNTEQYHKKVNAISKYFKQYKDFVQLLCFSMDTRVNETARKKYAATASSKKDIYYDVTGRGFALPRMWAQYAQNNVLASGENNQ